MYEIQQATTPQIQFWNDPAKFRGFVGGIGSGKTFAGAIEILRQPAGSVGMVLAPTFPMLKTATLRTFLEIAEPAGLVEHFNKADMEMRLIGNRTVFWRSADNPDRIRGPNLGWFWMDEAAMCDEAAWLITIGRLRKSPAIGWITTTPRGTRHWLYGLVKNDKISITHAASRTNTFNPADFVESVSGHGDTSWLQQELEGKFVEPGGKVFRREWFEIVEAAPQGDFMKVRAWDCAATEDGGDATTGAKFMRASDLYYVEHEVYGHFGPAAVDATIRQTAMSDTQGVVVLLEEEAGSSGKRANEHIINAMPGYVVISEKVTGSKLIRALPMAREAAKGRIKLVRGDWNEAWLDEVCDFTGEESKGAYHDDRVDAASLAFNYLNREQPFEWF